MIELKQLTSHRPPSLPPSLSKGLMLSSVGMRIPTEASDHQALSASLKQFAHFIFILWL